MHLGTLMMVGGVLLGLVVVAVTAARRTTPLDRRRRLTALSLAALGLVIAGVGVRLS